MKQTQVNENIKYQAIKQKQNCGSPYVDPPDGMTAKN